MTIGLYVWIGRISKAEKLFDGIQPKQRSLLILCNVWLFHFFFHAFFFLLLLLWLLFKFFLMKYRFHIIA